MSMRICLECGDKKRKCLPLSYLHNSVEEAGVSKVIDAFDRN